MTQNAGAQSALHLLLKPRVALIIRTMALCSTDIRTGFPLQEGRLGFGITCPDRTIILSICAALRGRYKRLFEKTSSSDLRTIRRHRSLSKVDMRMIHVFADDRSFKK